MSPNLIAGAAVLAAAFVAAPSAHAASDLCGRSVRVAPGDTVAAIANRCDTTVQAILDANPGLQPWRLMVGQRVDMPSARGERTGEAARVEPDVTISPRQGTPGSTVTIVATGFRPHEKVLFGVGTDAGGYSRAGGGRADASGRVITETVVPADAGGSVRFVVAAPDGEILAKSRAFTVAAAEPEREPARERVSLRGVVTGEGTECPAVRAEDGTLYTLAGTRGLQTGDVVQLRGRVAEVSTCMQGTTIEVSDIERIGRQPPQSVEEAVRQGAGAIFEQLGEALRNR